MKIAGHLYINFYRTPNSGFRAKLSRWEPGGKIGGFFVRGFHHVFMVGSDKWGSE